MMPSNQDMIIVTNVDLRKLKAFFILFVSNIGMRRTLSYTFYLTFIWFTIYWKQVHKLHFSYHNCIGIKMSYKTKMNRLNMEKIEHWWANLFDKLQYDIVMSMSEWKLDWTSFYNFINSCRIYYFVYSNNNWDSNSS